MSFFFTILVVAVAVGLLQAGRGYLAWTVSGGLALLGWSWAGIGSSAAFSVALLAPTDAAFVLGRPGLRRRLVTPREMPVVAKLLPHLGDTERIALEAGKVAARSRRSVSRASLPSSLSPSRPIKADRSSPAGNAAKPAIGFPAPWRRLSKLRSFTIMHRPTSIPDFSFPLARPTSRCNCNPWTRRPIPAARTDRCWR